MLLGLLFLLEKTLLLAEDRGSHYCNLVVEVDFALRGGDWQGSLRREWVLEGSVDYFLVEFGDLVS